MALAGESYDQAARLELDICDVGSMPFSFVSVIVGFGAQCIAAIMTALCPDGQKKWLESPRELLAHLPGRSKPNASLKSITG